VHIVTEAGDPIEGYEPVKPKTPLAKSSDGSSTPTPGSKK
jgi:hypothetical protein